MDCGVTMANELIMPENYLDSEGNVLKPYIIRDVDWIQFKMDEAKDGDN